MSLREDAISALGSAAFVNVDLDSSEYPEYVATHLSSKKGRSYVASDEYVQEVVEYSRQPEIIDAAVDRVGELATEIGRRKYGTSPKWNWEPLKEDLKRTFGRGR